MAGKKDLFELSYSWDELGSACISSSFDIDSRTSSTSDICCLDKAYLLGAAIPSLRSPAEFKKSVAVYHA